MDSIGGKRVGRTRQSTSSQQSSRRRRSRNATTGASGRTSRTPFGRSKLLLSLIAAGASTTMAQSCVPLAGSTTCPAFGKSSVSTSEKLTGLFPFLQGVSSIQNFDEQLRKHIESTYTQVKYQQLLGCSSVDLSNSSDLYARYTASVLCNAMIQNSIEPCGLSSEQAPPLCANSCAEFATSEHILSSNPALCGSRGADALAQIRADFTNCALPANSLAGNCVEAAENEPNDCGYHENLGGLCGFCRQSSLNATDSCCITAGVESRCEGLQLPTFSYDPEVFTIPSSTSTAGPTSTAAASAEQPTQGLTGGQVAGIAVGAVLAALLLLALIIACAMVFRRRKHQTEGSPFNKPAPFRQMQQQQQQPHMGYIENDNALGLAPGGRVARMAALEAESTSSESRGGTAPHIVTASRSYRGSTSDYHDSPRSGVSGRLPKRAGSLSSGSALAATTTEDPTSPRRPVTAEPYSSPDAVTSGQSEQLSFFKDYYSQDEIRPGDAVSTLWAYQPRANDEFELERGDMLKVVGIWDDGWATGTRLGGERAEDWDERKRKREQRDSGVSNGSGKAGTDGGDEGDKSADDGTVEGGGEIKAFPLVCVCLPQHWKKTIEGDSVETTATGPQPPTSPVSPASPASGET